MPGVKTAISIEKHLFDRVDKLAHDMHVSRSRLFTLAMKDYLKKQENESLLAKLNEVYGDPESKEDQDVLSAHSANQRKILENEQW